MPVAGDAEDDSVVDAGVDDPLGDATGADAVRVARAEDFGGHFLLVVGELGESVRSLRLRGQEDEVRAVGPWNHLEGLVAYGGSDDGHRRGDLPWVVVPTGAQAGQCGRARRRSAVVSWTDGRSSDVVAVVPGRHPRLPCADGRHGLAAEEPGEEAAQAVHINCSRHIWPV